jgi:hypothetical protein
VKDELTNFYPIHGKLFQQSCICTTNLFNSSLCANLNTTNGPRAFAALQGLSSTLASTMESKILWDDLPLNTLEALCRELGLNNPQASREDLITYIKDVSKNGG